MVDATEQVVRVRRQAVLALAKLGFAAAEAHAEKVSALMRAEKEMHVRLACVPEERAALMYVMKCKFRSYW